jgi:hypothetical protein
MRTISPCPLLASLTILLLTNCAPKPTNAVDLSRARATLQLADGSSISSESDDDINPILIQKPDGFVILVFASDRPCSGCTDYNLFITESVEPIYDPYDLPAFNTPQAINSGSPLNVSAGRFNYQVAWRQGGLLLYYENAGQIFVGTMGAGNVASGSLDGSPQLITNSAHYSDSLVSVDFRLLRMMTVDGAGDVYSSLINSVDSGTLLGNDQLSSATSAAPVSPSLSGYTDARVYDYFGEVAYGFDDSPGDYMYNLNAALADAGLDLSYVSAYETESPFINGLLFSAGDSGQHNLYAVDSHTLDELWFLEADYGLAFSYTDNFNIFVTAQTFDGDLTFGSLFPFGVYGADFACNVDGNRPVLTSYYKAMLVDGAGNRVACTTPNCTNPAENVDWVMQPGTSYVSGESGKQIATTNTAGIFSFSVTNAISSSPFTAWAGFNSTDWTRNTTNHCSNYTDNVTVGSGSAGTANDPTGGLIYTTTPSCTISMSQHLYCVEQP